MKLNQSIWRFKTVGILMLVLCALSIGENIACFTMAVPIKLKIGAVVGLSSCACALYYMFMGYRKNAAAAYRVFLVIMFITFQFMAATINIKNQTVAVIISMLACLKAAFTLVIAVSSDTGAKFSKVMALSIAVIATIELLGAVLIAPNAARESVVFVRAGTLRTASNFFVAWMAYVMTLAKYMDKTERGTK